MDPQDARIDPETFFEPNFVLPPLPEVATRVRELIETGDANANQVADMLASDPALTAQILAIVNSAYYALPREVSDVRHAVAYLGLSEVHRVVLTASVMTTLAPTDRKHFDGFWFHSFYTALVAKLIARRFERTMNPEPLYASALLHDVGKLVYVKFFPDHFNTLSEACEQDSIRFVDAEKKHDFPSHALFGSVLCQRWGLPKPIGRACEAHELEHVRAHNAGDELDDYLKVIAVANLLCNLELADTEYKSAIHQQSMAALGCSDEGFLLLMGEVYEQKDEVQRFLDQLK